MFAGRKKELSYLEESYSQDGSRIIVMYGYRGVGKTTLLKRFAEKKDLTYFLARPCSDEEERLIWNRECGGDAVDPEMQEVPSYTDILGRLISAGGGKKILAIDEFQNIIRYSPDFMEQLVNFINASDTQIFCVLLSSSISFVENDLVSRIGKYAMSLNGFFKIPELCFLDCVNYFSKYSTKQCMEVYGILGGIPAYWKYFSDEKDLKSNIISTFLADGAPLKEEGMRVVSDELRETNVYCTILNCLAADVCKLNDLHKHTGYTRAKISVYLKTLMEMGLATKVFPFDGASSINARKGIYRIPVRLLIFYFRFLYSNASALEMMNAEDFYENIVSPGLSEIFKGNFRRVCSEYLDILSSRHALPIEVTSSGEWPGKDGDIDIIMQNDEGDSLIGFCRWDKDEMQVSDMDGYYRLIKSASLHPDHIFVFSAGTFSDDLKKSSDLEGNIRLIATEDL